MNQEPKFCVRCKHMGYTINEYKCHHPRCLDIVTESPRSCEEVRQDTCLVQGVYFEPKPEK